MMTRQSPPVQQLTPNQKSSAVQIRINLWVLLARLVTVVKFNINFLHICQVSHPSFTKSQKNYTLGKLKFNYSSMQAVSME